MQDESGKAASGSPAEASTSTAQVGAEVCCSDFSLLSPQQAHNYVWVLHTESNVSYLKLWFNFGFFYVRRCCGGGRKNKKMSLHADGRLTCPSALLSALRRALTYTYTELLYNSCIAIQQMCLPSLFSSFRVAADTMICLLVSALNGLTLKVIYIVKAMALFASTS